MPNTSTTIHDLPPELIHQILQNLSPSPSLTPTTAPSNPDAPLPSAFDQFRIYGPFASTSRQLYEITAPFLFSSLTINAIVDNIGMDHHQHTPIAFHGICVPELQRSIRHLKEMITARDPRTAEGRGVSSGMKMCSYIKSVSLIFVNQQTTRPGLFWAPHCQACAMTQEEVEAAKPLAKADFDEYIASMPAARAALTDLVKVLGRLDGLESFAVWKRRNHKTEAEWGCEPVELDGWVNVRDDGCVEGLEELSTGMVKQIVRLCNLPTLRRLTMNCRIPSFVWSHNIRLEAVKVKGMLEGVDGQANRGGWEGRRLRWDAFRRLVRDAESSSYREDDLESRRKVNLDVTADGSEGLVLMVDNGLESLQRVQAARFDIRFRKTGKQRAIESWLYKFLTLSAGALEQLDLVVEELPKIRTSPPSAISCILPTSHSSRQAPPILRRVQACLRFHSSTAYAFPSKPTFDAHESGNASPCSSNQSSIALRAWSVCPWRW